VYIVSLQPQLAEYMATVSQGFLPMPGDSCLWVEMSPGMTIHRLTDIALKTTRVHLAQQVVERAYGSIVIYHRDQSDVQEAGRVILQRLSAQVSDQPDLPDRVARSDSRHDARSHGADQPAELSRFHPSFRILHVLLTPAHASWPNQAEWLLRAFSERYLKRGNWTSRADLICHLQTAWREYNELLAHPFH
jgi:hypothetical protein